MASKKISLKDYGHEKTFTYCDSETLSEIYSELQNILIEVDDLRDIDLQAYPDVKADLKKRIEDVMANMELSCEIKPPKYEVYAHGVGLVYDSNSKDDAMQFFDAYFNQSKSGHGHVADERAVLMEDGKPIKLHYGTRKNEKLVEVEKKRKAFLAKDLFLCDL